MNLNGVFFYTTITVKSQPMGVRPLHVVFFFLKASCSFFFLRIFTHLNVTRPKKKRKRNDSLLSTSESAACSFLLLLLLLLLFACVYFCFHFSPTCPCSLTAQFAIDRSGGGSNGGWGGGGGVRLPCQPKKERERERELSEDLLARKFRVRLFSSIPGKRAVLGETKATSCFIDRLLPIYDTTARRLWSINPVSPPHLRPRLLFPNRKKSFKSDLIFRKFPLGPPHVSQKEIKDIFFCFPLRSSFGEKRRIRWRGFDGSFSGTVISLLNFALDFLDSALYSRWCMQNNWPFRQLRVPFSAADSNAICWRFYLQHFSFQSTLAGLIIETHTPRSIISGVIIQIFRRRKPGVFTFFSQGLLPFFLFVVLFFLFWSKRAWNRWAISGVARGNGLIAGEGGPLEGEIRADIVVLLPPAE